MFICSSYSSTSSDCVALPKIPDPDRNSKAIHSVRPTIGRLFRSALGTLEKSHAKTHAEKKETHARACAHAQADERSLTHHALTRFFFPGNHCRRRCRRRLLPLPPVRVHRRYFEPLPPAASAAASDVASDVIARFVPFIKFVLGSRPLHFFNDETNDDDEQNDNENDDDDNERDDVHRIMRMMTKTPREEEANLRGITTTTTTTTAADDVTITVGSR